MLVVFSRCVLASSLIFFFFNDTATTEIYTLSYTTLFRSLIGADGDRIHALADRPRRTEGRPRQRVAAGDDVVEEHGAQPAALEIQVRLLHALVEHSLHAGRGAHQVERERALERAHALATQIAEAVHGPVLAPHDERLGEGEVRPREGDPRAARGRHLDAVEGHAEVAALERGDQRLPVVLRELGAHVE